MNRKLNIILSLLLLSIVYSASEWTQISELPSDQKRLNLVESDIYTTTVKFYTDGLYSVDSEGIEGVQLRLENGAQLLEQGHPDLPMQAGSIIIPDDQAMEVRVVKSKFQEFENIDVLPSKGNLSRMIDPSSVPYEYDDVYTCLLYTSDAADE